MGLQDKAKKAASAAASVAVATTGLSSCHDNGAVDPLPPPLECNTVDIGQSLVASAERNGDTLTVHITNDAPFGVWKSAQVTDPVGATVASVELPREGTRDTLVATFTLLSASTMSGSFTVSGELMGLEGNVNVCAFSRTFTFTVGDSGVTVTLLLKDFLPLSARQRAEIVMIRRDGRVVDLKARTDYQGRWEAEWQVTSGSLETVSQEDQTMRWRLPEGPGIHQVELVMDYGADGMAVDALALEVV